MRSWMSSASSLGSSVGLGGDAARPELPCTEPAVLLRPPHRCSHSLLTRSALEHRRYLNGPGRPPISGFGFALSSGPIRGGWPLERFAPRHDWVIGPGPPPEALTRPPGPAIKPAGAKRTSTSTRHDMLRSSAALLPLLLGVCFAGCSTKARTFDTPEESSSGGSAGDKGKSSGGSGSGIGGQGGSHSEEPEPAGPCKDHQCQNGATCEPDGDEDYTCLCAEGFEGDRCEVDIDECADDPCENGGTCANQVGAYECTCPAQWTGKNCHLPRFEVLPENFIPAKLNADGTVAIGKIPTTGANSQAARYLNGQLRELGLFSGDSTSEALAVSSDGETIVGTGAPTVGASRAIRWRGTNMVQLPPVNDDDACRATSVTADGQLTVGVCAFRLVRWTSNGVEDLGIPPGTMICQSALVS